MVFNPKDFGHLQTGRLYKRLSEFLYHKPLSISKLAASSITSNSERVLKHSPKLKRWRVKKSCIGHVPSNAFCPSPRALAKKFQSISHLHAIILSTEALIAMKSTNPKQKRARHRSIGCSPTKWPRCAACATSPREPICRR